MISHSFFAKLYFTSMYVGFPIIIVAMLIMMWWSRSLCLKVRKIEPEFFLEKGFFSYMTNQQPSQFALHVIFNRYKRIKDEKIRNKCRQLRKYFFFVIFPLWCYLFPLQIAAWFFSTNGIIS